MDSVYKGESKYISVNVRLLGVIRRPALSFNRKSLFLCIASNGGDQNYSIFSFGGCDENSFDLPGIPRHILEF